MVTALIDADIVGFRCSVSCESKNPLDPSEILLEDEWIAHARVDKMMREILNDTGADTYELYLSGSNNFRKDVSPEYKANRKDKIPPVWLQSCREFLVTEWKAIVTDGIEADDALGINQTERTILCSIDKDLKQIPGKHYNFVKKEFFEVTPIDGLRYFYKQLLIGDTTDNIFGIRGIGPKKAEKIIDPLTEEKDMFIAVRDLYKDDARLTMNGKLLWILQKEGEIWNPEPLFTQYGFTSTPSNSTDTTNSLEYVGDVSIQE